MKTYLITYYIYLTNGMKLPSQKIKVKRCLNEIEAKTKLETRSKNYYQNFGYLICTECVQWNPIQDIFSNFGMRF